jgi:hypothetical protein
MSSYKPKTSQHWASVTSAIARRAGVDFKTAKGIYDRLRAGRETRPSVGVVSNLPAARIRAYKAAETRAQARAARAQAPELQRRAKERAQAIAEARAAVTQRPRARAKAETAAPAPVEAKRKSILIPAPPPRQRERVPAAPPLTRKARNKFEEYCKRYGAPEVTGTLASLIAREWRNPKLQRDLAKTLAQAAKEVDKRGYVSSKTKARARKLLSQVEGTTPGHWFAFLRRAYRIRIRYGAK